MFVAVTTISPICWDDGIQDVFGPFETIEEAKAWERENPQGQEVDIFELKSPK